MSKVSLIVPIYNTEKYLETCINSILNQTMSDIELLLINDGSTDNSNTIMNEYKSDKRVKIFHQENKGQANARNRGIKLSTSDYITFIDSDDYIAPNMIEELYKMAQAEKSDITICDIIKINNQKELYFTNYLNLTTNKINNYIISHPGPVARLYKKDLFTKHNIYFKEDTIYEDLATIPLLGIYADKISVLKKGYYYYRIYQGSTMKQLKYNKKLENIFAVINYLETEFINRSNNKFSKELEFLFIEHLLYSASLRFFKFDKKDELERIVEIIKNKYPNFKRNIYYKKKSWKFKMICTLFFHKRYQVLSLITKRKKDL